MRVAIALVLGACWTDTATPLTTTPMVSDQSAYASSFQHRPVDTGPRADIPRRSVWQGTYVCTQGMTAVTLTIELIAGELHAIYEFGPHPSNPTVPEGSFEMRGPVKVIGRRSFSAELAPGEWIKRPAGYTAIPMTIEAIDREMTGTLASPNCREFHVTRID